MSNNTTTHKGRRVLSGLTALGSSQATAFPLLNGADHQFTTVAASTGAVLPAAKLADSVSVWNGGASTLSVYPPSGGKVNDTSANSAYSLSAGSGITFFAADLLVWYSASAAAASGVTSVTAGTGLTGGTITTTGTLALANPSASTLGGVQSAAAVSHQWINSISTSGVPALSQPAFTDISGTATLAQLPTIGDASVYGNTTGGTAAPAGVTLTALIDEAIGNTQGDVLYRGASAWSTLAPGTSGQVLATQGASANPHWVNASSGGTVTSVAASVPVDMAVAGSPITSSGTLAITRVGPPSTIYDYTFFGGV
jgi:hypothetical protein